MTPPDDFGQSMIGMPLIQVAFVAGGIGLIWRELRELPAAVQEAMKKAKPGEARDTRMMVLSASIKVLAGGLMMALFGITLLGVTAGLFQADRALNTFAVLMIPAIAALVYTSLNGVPESVAKVLLRE